MKAIVFRRAFSLFFRVCFLALRYTYIQNLHQNIFSMIFNLTPSSLEAVQEALEQVINPQSDIRIKIEGELQDGHPEWLEFMLKHELSEYVEAVLKEKVFVLNNIMMNNGLGSVGLLFTLPERLVQMVLETCSVESTMEWFNTICHASTAEARFVAVLWGLQCKEHCQLSPKIEVMPFESFESSSKEWIREHYTPEGMSKKLGTPLVPFVTLQEPDSILIIKTKIEPLFESVDARATDDTSLNKDRELLSEIIQILTFVGPCSVATGAMWFEFVDSNIRKLEIGRQTIQPGQEIFPSSFKNISEFDNDVAKQVVNDYLNLDSKLQQKFLVSAGRLNNAIRRSNIGNQAIELVTAMESLVVGADGKNGEITFKIALRTALLLGNTFSERDHIRKLIKTLYAVRSDMVHEGAVKPENLKKFGLEQINEVFQICASIAQKIITTGKIPDWNSLELGGGVKSTD